MTSPTNRTDEASPFFEQAHEIVKKHYTLIYHGLVRDIASAIQSAVEAERARCAKLARDFNDGYSYTGKDIAKAIEQTPTQEGV